jgi:hypothetical protein
MACIVTEKAFFGNDSLPQKSANPKHRWVIGQRMTPYASKIHPNSQKIQKFLPTAAFLSLAGFHGSVSRPFPACIQMPNPDFLYRIKLTSGRAYSKMI